MATSAGATRPADQITFAHNSERQFARLLDFYRVEWEYEPTAFPIEWDAAGQPVQLFRPDFYLPGFRLYIEITTLNQRLVTKKNRKVRRLRELYPDVRIKVLYQRDYLSLLAKYGLEPPSQMVPPPTTAEAEGGPVPASEEPGATTRKRPGGGVEGGLSTGGRPGSGCGSGGAGRSSGRVRVPARRRPAAEILGLGGELPVAGAGGAVERAGPPGGRGWCPTRRSRFRHCPRTPSWYGWPRCSSRPRSPSAAAPPPPGRPADPPLRWARSPGGALRGLRRAVVQSPRPGWVAGRSYMDSSRSL